MAKTLGHDLRTPLGTIANYAAILAENPRLDVDEARESALRIRGHAMESAKMLDTTLRALLIAARPPAPAPFDAAALLAEIATQLGDRVQVVVDADPEVVADSRFDPELVAFVWKTLLEFLRVERPAQAHDAWISRRHVDGREFLVVAFGGADAGSAAVPIASLLAGDSADHAAARGFGLALCRELVAVRGATLELSGRPGAAIAMRLATSGSIADQHAN